jgi:uncharacterized protein GlcG (DUF336 family)
MNKKLSAVLLLAVSSAFAAPAFAANADRSGVTCADLPTFAQLQTALAASVNSTAGGTNGTSTQGFGLPMWATLVDSSGRVCAVAKLGGTDPWLGSRVISAQKANTANAFSTNQIALSTANLYSAVQPGGSLYGLQHSNPVNTIVAYRGAATAFGTASDPMVGLRIGGVNVFGGGLALYNAAKQAIGAIGVSGDSSCADHNIAWALRTNLVGKGAASGIVANLVPGGVSPGATAAGSDNIQYPASVTTAATGWQQPMCSTSVTVPALGALGN